MMPYSVTLSRVVSRDTRNAVTYGTPEVIDHAYIEEGSFRNPNRDDQTLEAKGLLILPYMTWPDPSDPDRKVTISVKDRIELPDPFQPRFPTLVGVRIVSDEDGPHHLEILYR